MLSNPEEMCFECRTRFGLHKAVSCTELPVKENAVRPNDLVLMMKKIQIMRVSEVERKCLERV